MNFCSTLRTDSPSGGVIHEPVSFHEARLWDHARLNLTLLYGGHRSGGKPGAGAGRNPENAGPGIPSSEPGRLAPRFPPLISERP